MHVDIDKYAQLSSGIHCWDSRCKIVSFLALVLVIAITRTIPGALAGLFLALVLMIVSRLPLLFLLNKVKVALLFLVPLFLLLPLTSGGKELYTWSVLSLYYDGLYMAGLIGIKTTAIILLFTVMMSSATFTETASALRTLKIPVKLLNMILFTYRYLFVYFDDLRKMKTALTLRGFRSRSRIRSWISSANLIGSMLIRSYEQTERVYNAMILRGYSGEMPYHHEFDLKGKDFVKMAGMLAVAGCVLAAEILMRAGWPVTG
ncbi:MAG: cobalt ECF transporter T component CbiQ [bacterium]|nr:cobalt ECF transporter T component CbiQ [bacterium]